MSDKVKSIIAHITVIGWIIAFVMNLTTGKTPQANFYLRQTFGLFLIGIFINLLPIRSLSLLISLVVLGLLIYSLLGAINGERRELPVIGKYFQDWFKFI